MDMMFEEGHLHRCEACDDYYRHDDYKCNKYTNWGKCKKHRQNELDKFAGQLKRLFVIDS